MATIGFNNTRNVWTSKYTFETSMYSNINNRLYSYGKNISPSDDIIYHQHNVGDTNTFYGQKSNSVISVSFNQNPSENKIYKSFSIEGTKNLASIGSGCVFETSFTLDDSTRKNFTLGPIRYKGGQLYAYMGKDDSLKNGFVVNYIGTGQIEASSNYTDDAGFEGTFLFRSDNLRSGSLLSNSSQYPTKFLFSFPSEPSVLYHLNSSGNAEQVNTAMSYSDVGLGISLQDPYADGNYVTEYGLVLNGTGDWVNALYEPSEEGETMVNLFSVSDPRVNGDFLRGQFAEAHISLGTQPFELYSLNLYYEPTPLDHSS